MFQDNDECTWYGSFFVADMLLSWQIPPNISRRFLELWYGHKYTCYIIAILVSRNKVDFSVMDYHKLFKVWWLETMYPILDQKFFVLLLTLSLFSSIYVLDRTIMDSTNCSILRHDRLLNMTFSFTQFSKKFQKSAFFFFSNNLLLKTIH